jgi:phosphoserine phosphatase
MIISRPWLLLPAALALPKGRSGFKHRVSQLFDIDPTSLPYRQSVIDYIKTARQSGQRTVLATAATMHIARRVFDHIGIFDDLIASEEGVNRKGTGKLDAIRERFGQGPFDYMGDSSADIPIFAASRRAILVHPSSSVREASGKRFQPYLIIE